jgi:hypothetical protein
MSKKNPEFSSLEVTYEKYRPALPDGDLTLEDFSAVDSALRRIDIKTQDEWTEAHRQLHRLPNGQRFSMIVDRPKDGDPDRVVIVPGEYGKGTDADHVLGARIFRDMSDPEATLVYQPTSTLHEDNMNYSPQELSLLRDGNMAPLMDRFGVVLSSLDNPSIQTLFGSSQGGTVALGYAADRNTPSAPAVAVYEAPNVELRPGLKLMTDFVGNSGDLKLRYHENHNGTHPIPVFIQDAIALQSLGNAVRFARGLIKPENTAMITLMRQNSAQEQMEAILAKGGSVVHAYGTVDNVSPLAANEKIARALQNEPKYLQSVVEEVGHEVSILYAFNGALGRVARRLVEMSA